MSRFFIDRPIFASVLSAFIVIAGLAALRVLPVAQYPDILPPEVDLQAFYPGANAETVAETVAAPLEQAINGVDDMLYVRSASAGNGSLGMTITFAIGTDPDLAAINVNNRVQSALSQLPEEVRRQGVSVRKRSTSFLQIIALDSDDPRFDAVFISNFALLNVVDELRRVPGVGDAQIFGAKDYSIRVWLRPDRLAQLGEPGEDGLLPGRGERRDAGRAHPPGLADGGRDHPIREYGPQDAGHGTDEAFAEVERPALLRAPTRPGEAIPRRGVRGLLDEEELRAAPLVVGPEEARRDDPRVVDDEEISRVEEGREVGDVSVSEHPGRPVERHETRGAARRRALGDRLRGQVEVEVRDVHGWILSVRRPGRDWRGPARRGRRSPPGDRPALTPGGPPV